MTGPGGGRVRAYFLARRAFDAVMTVVQGAFDGLWLGVLDREHFHVIDDRYYTTHALYAESDHNFRGLFDWEQRVVDRHFRACRRLAVVGAGAGREVIALQRAGFEVDGFECNPALVERGNELLRESGLSGSLRLMPRDRWPQEAGHYDGVIIGWGAYTLVQEGRDRVALLTAARSRLPEGGPILVSFLVRPQYSRYFRLACGVANRLRTMRRRTPVELGASLAPNRVQIFTLAKVAQELSEAGFSILLTSADDYGHAVGAATSAP